MSQILTILGEVRNRPGTEFMREMKSLSPFSMRSGSSPALSVK